MAAQATPQVCWMGDMPPHRKKKHTPYSPCPALAWPRFLFARGGGAGGSTSTGVTPSGPAGSSSSAWNKAALSVSHV